MTKSVNTTNNHFELTQSAAKHFSSLLQGKENQNIRIGIRDSGCSGYAYFLEFSEKVAGLNPKMIASAQNYLILNQKTIVASAQTS